MFPISKPERNCKLTILFIHITHPFLSFPPVLRVSRIRPHWLPKFSNYFNVQLHCPSTTFIASFIRSKRLFDLSVWSKISLILFLLARSRNCLKYKFLPKYFHGQVNLKTPKNSSISRSFSGEMCSLWNGTSSSL